MIHAQKKNCNRDEASSRNKVNAVAFILGTTPSESIDPSLGENTAPHFDLVNAHPLLRSLAVEGKESDQLSAVTRSPEGQSEGLVLKVVSRGRFGESLGDDARCGIDHSHNGILTIGAELQEGVQVAIARFVFAKRVTAKVNVDRVPRIRADGVDVARTIVGIGEWSLVASMAIEGDVEAHRRRVKAFRKNGPGGGRGEHHQAAHNYRPLCHSRGNLIHFCLHFLL